MDVLKKILSDRRFHRLSLVAVLLFGGLALWGWRAGVDLEMLKTAWKEVESGLRERPWLLFAALVILPAFPLPVSPLMFLAGTVWSRQPALACAISLTAMALNMSWTYWVAARPGRGMVLKLTAAMNLRVPTLPKDDYLRMVLLLRLTPGLPFFVQNFLLGFFHVPFRLYLPVSMACSGMVSAGVVLSGAGMSDGNLVPVMTGAGLIVFGAVVLQMLRKKLAKVASPRA